MPRACLRMIEGPGVAFCFDERIFSLHWDRLNGCVPSFDAVSANFGPPRFSEIRHTPTDHAAYYIHWPAKVWRSIGIVSTATEEPSQRM